MSEPVATPSSGTLLPPESSTSQASECTPAVNSGMFLYSAETSADNVSTSATISARRTARARRVYGRNPALFLKYLERKIKLITSQMDLYTRDVESDISVVKSKMSSSDCNLDNAVQLVNACKDAHVEVVKEMESLNAVKDSDYHDCSTLMECWKADRSLDTHELDSENLLDCDLGTDELINEDSFAHYVDRQIELLSARKDLLARNLITQVQQLKATNESYVDDVVVKIINIWDNIDSFRSNITKQCELLESEKGPFTLDFDRQLKLLNSKLASFTHDLGEQRVLLISFIEIFEKGLMEKLDPLNNDMISYLGQDFELQECFSPVLELSFSMVNNFSVI